MYSKVSNWGHREVHLLVLLPCSTPGMNEMGFEFGLNCTVTRKVCRFGRCVGRPSDRLSLRTNDNQFFFSCWKSPRGIFGLWRVWLLDADIFLINMEWCGNGWNEWQATLAPARASKLLSPVLRERFLSEMPNNEDWWWISEVVHVGQRYFKWLMVDLLDVIA